MKRRRERTREKERGVLPIVPSESLLMQRCRGDRLTGLYGYSNMASSWSARSSNMLPMSSRIFPAAFTVLLPLWNRQDNVTSLLMRVYRLKLFRCCLPVKDRGQNFPTTTCSRYKTPNIKTVISIYVMLTNSLCR